MVIKLVLRINSFEQVPNENFIKIEGCNGFNQTIIDIRDIQSFWVMKHFEKQNHIKTVTI